MTQPRFRMAIVPLHHSMACGHKQPAGTGFTPPRPLRCGRAGPGSAPAVGDGLTDLLLIRPVQQKRLLARVAQKAALHQRRGHLSAQHVIIPRQRRTNPGGLEYVQHRLLQARPPEVRALVAPLLVKYLRPAFLAASVLVEMDAQEHVGAGFLRDVHSLLQVLALAGLARGVLVLREAYVLPPRERHLRPARRERLFHLKGDFQRHVLLPPPAVPGPRAAVITAVPGVQRHPQAAQRPAFFRLHRHGRLGGASPPPSARPPAAKTSTASVQIRNLSGLFCYNFM